MNVAITADLHLSSRHPERYETLVALFELLLDRGIDQVIIAGDLFDTSQRNVAEFEAICQRDAFQPLKLWIIPGNHDAALQATQFTASNVTVINSPKTIRPAPTGMPFLMLPYQLGVTMGDALAQHAGALQGEPWVLIGHGDWSGGLRVPNPTEPGVYMPLTRSDVEQFRPKHVFLGHIHRPLDEPPVHYVGSPCPLDITETGPRRVLVFDAATGRIEPMRAPSPFIFFDERLVIVPVDDEAAYLRQQIAQRIDSWQLEMVNRQQARVRIKVSGYSADRSALPQVIEEAFADFEFYAQPDLTEVSSSQDVERHFLASRVRDYLNALDWSTEAEEPTRAEILLNALHVIYRD
jgi:DNA repair exonuclease SbcCD nuclease subunit